MSKKNVINFIRVVPIGNKFVLQDAHGNVSKKFKNGQEMVAFIDTREEAEAMANNFRYANVRSETLPDGTIMVDEEEHSGMFWDWWYDLCKISHCNEFARMFFYDKVFTPTDEKLEDYLESMGVE